MSTHRDDEMSKSKKAPPFGKDDGDEQRPKRAYAGGALNPDNGTPHAEHGAGKHEHSTHMPSTTHRPKQ